MCEFNEEINQYTFGLSDCLKQLLGRRGIETHGQFVKPYLQGGMSMLDCGCGPGTMTIDFARIISPGRIIGIDIDKRQLESAKKTAQDTQVSNAEFKQASILNLPFDDNAFDIVFAQALLMHLKKPFDAINEMKRVTKKAGLIIAKEPYCSGVMIYPNNDLLKSFWELRRRPFLDNGGNDDLGIELGTLFGRVGLKDIKHNMWCRNYIAKDIGNYYIEEAGNYPYNEALLAKGEITKQLLKSHQEAWRIFSQTQGAFYGFIWGECVGRK